MPKTTIQKALNVREIKLSDEAYKEIFLKPIRTCRNYKPKFGQGGAKTVSLSDFKSIYGEDNFYAWIGLDSDLMYAAHKAAGGMTSVYRQIGVGCERLFQQIILDNAGYSSPEFAKWSYETTKIIRKKGQEEIAKRILTLDGRLEFSEINNKKLLTELTRWVNQYCEKIDSEVPKNGVVFEVRQGYKSKDSKRQNADLANASTAWAKGYLPIFAIFSAQIDADNVNRYINGRAGILIGTGNEDPLISLFAFSKNILGYDLADFFERNSKEIKKEITEVLEKLLSA